MPYHSSCCVVVCCLTFGHCASVSFSPHEFVNEFMRVCIISCMECHFSHRIHTLRSEYRPSIWTELLDHSSFGIRRLRRHRRRCHFFSVHVSWPRFGSSASRCVCAMCHSQVDYTNAYDAIVFESCVCRTFYREAIKKFTFIECIGVSLVRCPIRN